MKLILLLLCSALFSTCALADAAEQCHQASGSYLTGTVTSAPVFVKGKKLKGVELSHTHLTIKADSDKQLYDVAMDNVFADGYIENAQKIPTPLSTIKVGERLELCGQRYSEGNGIHWVHTNCGVTPTPEKPNGWVKKISNGKISRNYEDLPDYCYLWE